MDDHMSCYHNVTALPLSTPPGWRSSLFKWVIMTRVYFTFYIPLDKASLTGPKMKTLPFTKIRRCPMIRYVTLFNFTDQGIRNVKQTTDRAKSFKSTAEKLGATLKDLYWTQGAYDLVATIEVPDEQTGMSLLLALGSLGNIRSQSLRAFTADEMKPILSKMP
jgi:uncharacterized protein with GYD domain